MATAAQTVDATHTTPSVRLQVGASAASIFGPLNSTMLAVALPRIRDDFHVGVGALTLLISAYLIATAVLQPAAGRLGDAFGHLRMVQLGLLVLVVTSVAAALSWSFAALVVLRSLQGAAAALTMPNVVAYLRKRVPAAQLSSALGLNGSLISIGAAGGPVLGGLLLELGGWELLFLANVPLGLVGMFLVSRLDMDKGAGANRFHLDWLSMAALTLVFAGLTGLGAAIRSGSPLYISASVAVCVVAAAGYLFRYRRRGTGVLDLRLFRHRNFLVASLLVLAGNLLMYTTLVAMPVYLDEIEHAGDATIGGLLFAMSAALVVVSPGSGRAADRVGDRALIVAGAVALLVSIVGLGFSLDRWPLVVITVFLLLVGVGMGLAQAPQQSTALKSWPPEVAGTAAGSFSLMRYTGSIAGAAMLAAALGDDPPVGAFQAVFAILALLGLANLALAFAIRGEQRV
jgi:MFS transporter, DHA2 family, methylenomycin A resistance protein